MTILSELWNMNLENAKFQLNTLLSKGYKITTNSNNIYIQVLSCIHMKNVISKLNFTEFEREILNHPNFISIMESNENSVSHEELLLKSVYMCGKHDLIDKINGIRKNMSFEISNKNVIGVGQENQEDKEDQEKKENKENQGNKENQEILSLRDNTYNESIEDICPLNPHDDESFYTFDPITKERILLEPHKIFHHKGQCFDYDSIFRYIKAGGRLNLDEEYIRRFLKQNGGVDFSNLGLIDHEFRNKVYHEGTKSLDLSNNYLTSLLECHIPKTLKSLIVTNNPIGSNFNLRVDTPDLMVLSLSNCSLVSFDCERVPNTLISLDLSNNKRLRNIYNKSRLLNLLSLNISGTSVTSIDFSQFVTVGEPGRQRKLKIICNKGTKYKKIKPDWIEVIEI